MPQPVPRIMLSAAGSGAGKTTMTAALLSALCSRGLQVQGWKCGPDYIDPMFHSHITGRPAYHADPFFLSEQPMAELVSRVSADADCAVFEGAMGFYDGIGQTDQASAYTVSQRLKIPVLLVVNPKGMGCSAAALCHGFQTFRTPNSICGILLNDIRSGMYNYYRELLERETGLPVLGYLPQLPQVQLESRHLGLMTAGEVEQLDEKIHLLGDLGSEKLTDYYNLCDVFCMPSYFEAYGLVFAEALTYGLPCIGRDKFAMSEFIEDGCTGRLISGEDAEELALDLWEVLQDPKYREEVERRREWYLREYSWDKVAQRICSVMEKNERDKDQYRSAGV